MEYKRLPLSGQIQYWEEYLEGLVEFANTVPVDTIKERLLYQTIIEECYRIVTILNVLRISDFFDGGKQVRVESSINNKKQEKKDKHEDRNQPWATYR